LPGLKIVVGNPPFFLVSLLSTSFVANFSLLAPFSWAYSLDGLLPSRFFHHGGLLFNFFFSFLSLFLITTSLKRNNEHTSIFVSSLSLYREPHMEGGQMMGIGFDYGGGVGRAVS
jgi:hypothetical protein